MTPTAADTSYSLKYSDYDARLIVNNYLSDVVSTNLSMAPDIKLKL